MISEYVMVLEFVVDNHLAECLLKQQHGKFLDYIVISQNISKYLYLF